MGQSQQLGRCGVLLGALWFFDFSIAGLLAFAVVVPAHVTHVDFRATMAPL